MLRTILGIYIALITFSILFALNFNDGNRVVVWSQGLAVLALSITAIIYHWKKNTQQ
jgi:uncharacterized membrane protein YqjE